ncbi:MAG: hypothetical protein IPG24_19760 [Leptospiraceae bacterium]|nr:hypothetical protein [Leptospiraceae bacterium]
MEKYQITKSISFRLNKVKAPILEEQVEKIGDVKEAEASLLRLFSVGQDLAGLLKQYIYKDNQKLKSSVTVHFRWLRDYTKDKFYNWKTESRRDFSREKRFKLSEVDYLKEVFEHFISDWDAIIQNLGSEISRKQEALSRKAEIGKIIKRIGTRNVFLFFENLIIESKDKNEIHLEAQLNEKIKVFKENLIKAEQWALPAQSAGIELAKASFNYYTINKKPKDFELEKRNLEKQLHNYDERFMKDIAQRENKLFGELRIIEKDDATNTYRFLYELIQNGEGKQVLEKTDKGLTVDLDSLYKNLKVFRAEQKKSFQEAVSKGSSYDDTAKINILFSSVDQKNNEKNLKAFNKYKEFTDTIQKLADQKNKVERDSLNSRKLQEEISRIRQYRGKLLFQGPSKRGEPEERFDKYLKFCKVYKDIALKRGRLVARLKGIEKEKIDSQRLKYWTFIIEKDKQHQLVLIPKSQSQKVYQKISSYESLGAGSSDIYYFESLTYRALKKLCFGVNGNTFIPEISEELRKAGKWNYEERDFGEHIFKIRSGVEEIRDEKRLIAFYKDVLGTDYIRKNREGGKIVLPSSFDEEVLIPEFSTEQEFHAALEKCCYLRKKKIPKDDIEKIFSECSAQIFTITSYDLEKQDKTNLKAHTKLWFDFWTGENEAQRFPLRLNPEIRILWREPKATRIEKYGKDSKLFDPKKRNRYLHPQFTLTTSFIENALHPEINYRFLDAKQKKDNVKKFNLDINAKLKPLPKAWYYGIDTGIVELASLCLIQKNGIPQTFEVLNLKEDKMNYDKTGYLKDGTKKKYKAIQNLSYFLNEDLYKRTFQDESFLDTFAEIFEKKEVSALDLSVSKIISGHIVMNGDITARLNVALANARRKIVDALIKNPSVQLSEQDYNIKVGDEIIFKGRIEFNAIKSWEDIQAIIHSSFEKDKENLARVQEDINKYRQVIAANVTGVIHFLYKKFPGLITIEYLDQSEVESHRKDFEGIIDNPVERALYRKFQTEGLTPPVSELWSIKNKNEQIGIIYFADPKDGKKGAHGIRCPKCGEKAYPRSEDDGYKKDKNNKIFQCKQCGFHNLNNSMGLLGLDSNDKVAAYNIAKRGLEILK